MKPEFPTFVVWQEYGDRDHRDTRHHRDTKPPGPAGGSQGPGRDSATSAYCLSLRAEDAIFEDGFSENHCRRSTMSGLALINTFR